MSNCVDIETRDRYIETSLFRPEFFERVKKCIAAHRDDVKTVSPEGFEELTDYYFWWFCSTNVQIVDLHEKDFPLTAITNPANRHGTSIEFAKIEFGRGRSSHTFRDLGNLMKWLGYFIVKPFKITLNIRDEEMDSPFWYEKYELVPAIHPDQPVDIVTRFEDDVRQECETLEEADQVIKETLAQLSEPVLYR